MTQAKFDLLKMQHARLISQINIIAIQANRELSLGGWNCDWAGMSNDCAKEAIEIENQIKEFIVNE
jgi:hypothetical protein